METVKTLIKVLTKNKDYCIEDLDCKIKEIKSIKILQNTKVQDVSQ